MSQITSSEGVRVLHTDDEPQQADLARTYLEKLADDISVETATSVRDALERLNNQYFDCIVSDYRMPGMNGITFLRAVREEYPNLPFVLFTGEGSEDVASKALAAGADSYLQKGGPEVYKLLLNRIKLHVKRNRSERHARIARDRLLTLYERTDGFYTLSEEWEITYWNQKMEQRTQRAAEVVVGMDFLAAFPEAVETEYYDNISAVMDERTERQFETYFEPHDRWLDVAVQPVDSGLFVQSRDVTEEKERKRELQYRNELLESFASTVSHDLRNPLSVAEGKLQLAQETGDFEHLEGVAQAHNQMRDLIDELLQLARGEDLKQTEIQLQTVAERAWSMITEDDSELVVADDLTIKAHDDQLRRLLENLLWNSIDHADASVIEFGALDNGFYVEDDGTGIPPENRERVFQSGFSTADQSPGYGLSIVESIAKIHDWTIEVTESDDGGARFEITGVKFAAK